MDDFLKEALEIVKAQASVRVMTEDEIKSMVINLSAGIRGISTGEQVKEEFVQACDPKTAIKERSISCCVCGKSFKILTKKHLASHDLDAATYREKFGYKKGLPLVCKALQRERRKKMSDMKLWTRRKSAGNAPEPAAEPKTPAKAKPAAPKKATTPKAPPAPVASAPAPGESKAE
jgi:predicted transcriptional regulator